MLYVYEAETLKVVKSFDTDEAFNNSEYADFTDGDWNDAGLAVTHTPAFGCIDGLHD